MAERPPVALAALLTLLAIALPTLGWRLGCAPDLDCERPSLERRPAAASGARQHLVRARPMRVRCQGQGAPLRGAAALLFDRRLDLNSATARELAAVPGVSRRLAADIAAHREAQGAFRSVHDLVRVPGIGERSAARLAQFLAIAGAAGTPSP